MKTSRLKAPQKLIEGIWYKIEKFDNTGIKVPSQSLTSIHREKQSFKNYPSVKIRTADKHTFTGFLTDIKGDSISLVDIKAEKLDMTNTASFRTKLHYADIQNMSLIKKSKIVKYGIWGLIPMAIGVEGIQASQGGLDALGPAIIFAGGFVITELGCSIGYLMGIDADIPWEEKSDDEKRKILNRLVENKYKSRILIKASPWAGVVLPPEKDAVFAAGGRLRMLIRPRAGFELDYGMTDWFVEENWNRYRYWSQIQYTTAGFFVEFTYNKKINPFISWGAALQWIENYDPEGNFQTDKEKHYASYINGGLEIPIKKWISLETRVFYILRFDENLHTKGFQLGITINPFEIK